MRQPYIHLAGNLSGWPLGMVPTPRILRRFDQYSSELVNGEEGGTYAPESPIVVGNARPGAVGQSDISFISSACLLDGDVETVKGNDTGDAAYESGLILNPGAYPDLQSSHSRIVVVHFAFCVESGVQNSGPTTTHDIDPVTLGARTVSPGYDLVSGPPVLTVALPFNARHRSANIFQVDFRFALAGQRSAIPGNKPKFRIARASSSAIQTMHTAAGGYDANGWLTDPAATVATYVNANKTRTVSYVPNQNHLDIDPSLWAYFVQIQTEDLTVGNGDVWLSAAVTLTNILNMKQE